MITIYTSRRARNPVSLGIRSLNGSYEEESRPHISFEHIVDNQADLSLHSMIVPQTDSNVMA